MCWDAAVRSWELAGSLECGQVKGDTGAVMPASKGSDNSAYTDRFARYRAHSSWITMVVTE